MSSCLRQIKFSAAICWLSASVKEPRCRRSFRSVWTPLTSEVWAVWNCVITTESLVSVSGERLSHVGLCFLSLFLSALVSCLCFQVWRLTGSTESVEIWPPSRNFASSSIKVGSVETLSNSVTVSLVFYRYNSHLQKVYLNATRTMFHQHTECKMFVPRLPIIENNYWYHFSSCVLSLTALG